MPEEKIKVLIADDSPLVREVLKDMIAGEPDLEVVGEAANGREAVLLTEKLHPHIITMDVLMPVMNGIEAVEEIMAYCPTPILIFSSAVNDKEMDVAFQSIARGALDVMEKPKVPSGEQYQRLGEEFLHKLRILSRIQVIPHLRGKRFRRQSQTSSPTVGPEEKAAATSRGGRRKIVPGAGIPLPERIKPRPEVRGKEEEEAFAGLVKLPPHPLFKRKLVGVGASTGGPKALVQIFRRLPRRLPLSFLTVQHIAHSFAPGLVNWLNRESPLKVMLAEDNMPVEGGAVYIAPTGVHMIYEAGRIRLTESPPVNSCRPSVDVLFESLAPAGAEVVAVLLTGMGRDGAQGLKKIWQYHGRTIVQDESSSVIFGMPKAAVELGAAEEIVPLSQIPEAIIKAALQ